MYPNKAVHKVNKKHCWLNSFLIQFSSEISFDLIVGFQFSDADLCYAVRTQEDTVYSEQNRALTVQKKCTLW